MKRWLLMMVFLVLLSGIGMAQDFRLHVQPSREQVVGDGDQQITMTVSARDPQGQIIPQDGTLKVRVSAGLAPAEVPMKNGVSIFTLTAPILDDQSKVLQRSIQFTQMLLSRFKELSGVNPQNVKEQAGKIAVDTAKKGPNFSSLTSVDGSRPEVLVVVELGQVKGKARLEVTRAAPSVIDNDFSGEFRGRDVTGQTSWRMSLQKGNGELFQDGTPEAIAVSSLGEEKFGFHIIYLADPRELPAMKKLSPRFLGMPTGIQALPGNTLYMFAPPVYFWRVESKSSKAEPDLKQPSDSVSVVARHNILPGDGVSTTEVVFRYAGKTGHPRGGVPLKWILESGGMGKLSNCEARTDSSGQARARYQVPTFKTEDLGQLGTARRDTIRVDYADDQEKSSYAIGEVAVLRCTDAFLKVDKPGFEIAKLPIVIASPWGELTGRLQAEVRRLRSPSPPEKQKLVQARCYLEGPALGGFKFEALSQADGSFKIELPMKNWPYYYKQNLADLKPVEFSRGVQFRRKSLATELYRFDEAFQNHAADKIYEMDTQLCGVDRKKAAQLDEKYRIIGDLVSLFKTSLKLTGDTGKEFLSQGWSLLGAVVSWANEKFKFTRVLEDKLSQANKNLEKLVGLRNELGGGGTKLLIYRKLRGVFGTTGLDKGRNPTLVILDQSNEKTFELLQSFLEDLAEGLSVIKDFPGNPLPDMIVGQVQKGFVRKIQGEFRQVLDSDPERVASVSDWLQRSLLARGADLRQHYLNIAAWRLAGEEAMALKNLVVDCAQAVAIVASAAGQPEFLLAFEKLKSLSEAIDKVYAASGFVLEAVNYCQLEAECLELFAQTNRAISSGVVAWIPLPAEPAWAEGGNNLAPPPSLELRLDGLTVQEASEQVLTRLLEWERWELAADPALYRLQAAHPGSAKDFESRRQALDDQVTLLLTRVVTDHTEGWEQEAKNLTARATELQTASQKVYADASALAPSPPRPLLLREPWTQEQKLSVQVSAAWVLLVCLVIGLRLRRLT